MDLNSNKEKSSKLSNTQITLDKIIGDGINVKSSPFLYLLQIATDDRKLNRNKFDKLNANNSSGNNIPIPLYGDISNNENDFVSQDIDFYIREIVENNDKKFLNGDENIFEYLIAKYLNIEKDKITEQERFKV